MKAVGALLAGSTKRKQAEQERIQAGLRLIEVMNGLKDKEMSFSEWFSNQNFDFTERTAYNLMKLAGSNKSNFTFSAGRTLHFGRQVGRHSHQAGGSAGSTARTPTNS